jgi:hypothetical protein
MTWLTWRQFRTQAIIAASALVAIAIALVITGITLRGHYKDIGLPACAAHHDCPQLATSFVNQVHSGVIGDYILVFYIGIAVLYLLPALIGLFWGAPLVAREFETGTLRLGWTQSVSRNRWLGVKVGLVALATIAVVGLLSLLITWWSSPIDRALGYEGQSAVIDLNRLDPALFGARDIVPIGYATFALVLGVAIGVLIRRTVPAMAATLAIFAAVQGIWISWIRPHLISPTVIRRPITSAFDGLTVQQPSARMTVLGDWHQTGAWVLSNNSLTPSGHVFTGPATSACLGNSMQACTAWILSKHLTQQVAFQPASRFWAFQWYETGLFVLLAVALAALSAWTLNRRRLA